FGDLNKIEQELQIVYTPVEHQHFRDIGKSIVLDSALNTNDKDCVNPSLTFENLVTGIIVDTSIRFGSVLQDEIATKIFNILANHANKIFIADDSRWFEDDIVEAEKRAVS
ncbi:hypothetical protein RZS08_51615, partial [Arthrospira platensis SPKY1]|nr:hypothetical protein [Arthrospira platensis SPKY1]